MTLTTENSGPIVRGTVQLAVVTQPADVEVVDQDPASFSAWADGRPFPTVQWQVSTDSGDTWDDVEDDAETGVSGATSAELTFDAAGRAADGYEYRAVFTNVVGSVTSDAATLTVAAAE